MIIKNKKIYCKTHIYIFKSQKRLPAVLKKEFAKYVAEGDFKQGNDYEIMEDKFNCLLCGHILKIKKGIKIIET